MKLNKQLFFNKYKAIPALAFVLFFAAIGYLLITLTHADSTSPTLPATYSEACPNAPVDYATCFALIRTDTAATLAKPAKTANVQYTSTPGSCAAGSSTIGDCGAYSPAELQAAYNLTPSSSGNGHGKMVALVDAGDDPTAEADLATYRTQFNLPPCTTANGCFHRVNQEGIAGNYPEPEGGWQDEIAIDLDMASAICPNCQILLVEANSNSNADLAAAANTAYNYGANAISNSYGSPEGTNGDLTYTPAQSAAYNHAGVAVTVASGDTGYGIASRFGNIGEGVSWPAVLPSVTAVGGTSLNQATDTTTRSATETAWQQGGSGCSFSQPKPSWQKDTGCSNRTITDVSAVADISTPVWAYFDGNWDQFGGTSVASPIIAGVIALGSDQYNYSPSIPYANPTDFNDITSGSNGTCQVAYLCNAGVGYDAPTGLGTPNGLTGFESTSTTNVPVVSITSPNFGANEVSGKFTITGKATDSVAISSVEISVDGGAFGAATGKNSWTATVNASALSLGLHHFVIKVINADGGSSLASIGLLTGNVSAPTVPVGLTGSATSPTQVNLTWQAPIGSAIPVASYNVYGTDAEGDVSEIASSQKNLSYTVNGLSPNTYYSFAVSAVGTNGQISTQSQAFSVQTPEITGAAPGAPVLSLVNAAYNSVSLSWTPSSSTIGISQYYVNNNTTVVSGYAVSGTTTSYVDYNVTPGTTYTYYVNASDYDNNLSPFSNDITVTTPTGPPATPITAPTNVTATAPSYNQVDLSWTISTGGTGGVASYKIFRSGTSIAKVGTASIDGVVNYVDGTVGPNTSYTYFVEAYDAAGNSIKSASVTVKTPIKVYSVSGLKGTIRALTAKGKALGGVKVTDTANTGIIYTATTNSAGVYELVNIPAGNSVLTYSLKGYTTYKATIKLTSSSVLTRNVVLTKPKA